MFTTTITEDTAFFFEVYEGDEEPHLAYGPESMIQARIDLMDIEQETACFHATFRIKARILATSKKKIPTPFKDFKDELLDLFICYFNACEKNTAKALNLMLLHLDRGLNFLRA